MEATCQIENEQFFKLEEVLPSKKSDMTLQDTQAFSCHLVQIYQSKGGSFVRIYNTDTKKETSFKWSSEPGIARVKIFTESKLGILTKEGIVYIINIDALFTKDAFNQSLNEYQKWLSKPEIESKSGGLFDRFLTREEP